MGLLSHGRYRSFIKSIQVCSPYLLLICVVQLSSLKYLFHAKSVACKTQCTCDWNSTFFNNTSYVRVNLSPAGPNCKADTDSWLVHGEKPCKCGWRMSENSNSLWFHDNSLFCWKRTEISDPLNSLDKRNESISQQHQVFTSLSLNQSQRAPWYLKDGHDHCHSTPQLQFLHLFCKFVGVRAQETVKPPLS